MGSSWERCNSTMEAGRQFRAFRESGRKGTQERGEGGDLKKSKGLAAKIMPRMPSQPVLSPLQSRGTNHLSPKKPLNARQWGEG